MLYVPRLLELFENSLWHHVVEEQAKFEWPRQCYNRHIAFDLGRLPMLSWSVNKVGLPKKKKLCSRTCNKSHAERFSAMFSHNLRIDTSPIKTQRWHSNKQTNKRNKHLHEFAFVDSKFPSGWWTTPRYQQLCSTSFQPEGGQRNVCYH